MLCWVKCSSGGPPLQPLECMLEKPQPPTLLGARPKARASAAAAATEATAPPAAGPLEEQMRELRSVVEQALQPKGIEMDIPVLKAALCLPACSRRHLIRSRRSAYTAARCPLPPPLSS